MSVLMSLFDRRPRGERSPWSNFWWTDHATGFHMPASGVAVTPETAMQTAAVFACVRVLAETTASLPLKVYRRLGNGGKEEAPDHPLYEVLHDQPNGWQTSIEFIEMLTGHTALRGRGLAQILPGRRGSVDQLIPLHPSNVKVERLENGRLRYQVRTPDGPSVVLTQDEVFDVRWMTDDGITVRSPIAVAREAIGLAIATERYGARFFANNARPSGILKTEQKLDKEARETLRASWQEAYGGENQNKTAILWGGLDWTSVGLPNEDAQFLETRKFQRNEIASIFRIPPHMIGDLERATFSNIEQQSLEFVIYTLRPWLVRWEKAIRRDLIQDPTYFAEFLVDGLLRGDIKARYEAYQIGVNNGWLSPNEVRRLENMNPYDGGDEFFSPLNMRPTNQPAREPDDGSREAVDAFRDDWRRGVVDALVGHSAQRIAAREINALSARVKHADKDRGRFNEWAREWFGGHRAYVAQEFGVVDECHAKAGGEPADRDRVASSIVEAAVSELEAGNDPAVVLESWNQRRAADVARIMLGGLGYA